MHKLLYKIDYPYSPWLRKNKWNMRYFCFRQYFKIFSSIVVKIFFNSIILRISQSRNQIIYFFLDTIVWDIWYGIYFCKFSATTHIAYFSNISFSSKKLNINSLMLWVKCHKRPNVNCLRDNLSSIFETYFSWQFMELLQNIIMKYGCFFVSCLKIF